MTQNLAIDVPFHEAPAAPIDTAWARFWAKALNDPRDVVFINLALQMSLTLLPMAIALFVVGQFSWWIAAAYWVFLFAAFLDRFILMLHCTCHRPLFNRRFKL